MKMWIMIAIGLLLIGGVFALTFTNKASAVEKTGCNGGCSKTSGCGQSGCSASTSGSCGCGQAKCGQANCSCGTNCNCTKDSNCGCYS